MRISLLPIFLVVLGIGGMILSVIFDYLKGGPGRFGTMQLAGLVVSSVVAMAGLRKLALPGERRWDGFLLLVYLVGILFMGLKPAGLHPWYSQHLLQITPFYLDDFTINVLGFVPLGYLLASYFISAGRRPVQLMEPVKIVASGIVISLSIELAQYYVPGRTSSLIDLAANGIGSTAGVLYYLIEIRLSGSR